MVDIKKIRSTLPNENVVTSLTDFFKMFSDPTRAKILQCLHADNLNVGEIAAALNMTVSAVSHQLSVLRAAKLVKGQKDGKEVKYSLDDDHVTKIIECGLAHVNEE